MTKSGGGLEYVHRNTGVAEGEEKGTRTGYNCHPVTGGHKYRDLVLKAGDWPQGLPPSSVTKLLLRNPKK
jgi:hypothetical protein